MKKLWANVLVFCLIFSIFSFDFGIRIRTSAAEKNKQGSFIANRLHMIGMDANDEPSDLEVPWKDTPDMTWWGRTGFLMPNAQLAKDPAIPTMNIPATEGNLFFTRPILWTIWYQDIEANAGRSQESKPWYVILDDAGQLWFDPDGRFNDPRYNARADLNDPNYVPGSCASNSQTQIDNQPGNNTQGPYIMDPSYSYNTTDPNPAYRANIFFWDNQRGVTASKRFWKLGWLDLVDYEANSFVKVNEWDIGLDIVHFNPGSDPLAVEFQDEMHVDLATTFQGRTTTTGQYDDGEFIYQKGTGDINGLLPIVQAGDLRESWVVITDSNNEQITYEPLSIVSISDLDLGLNLINFVGDDSIPLTVGHELHSDFGLRKGYYDTDEYIYQKQDGDNNGIFAFAVEIGDKRLSSVNTLRYTRESSKNPTINVNINNQNKGFGAKWLGGIWAGDALLLAEVLEGACNSSTYDISVQTDLWMGENPSIVSARLRSPTGDVLGAAQDIQKSTVLDPKGNKFYVPVTTFHNIKLQYREYIGLELWKDNGESNMFIAPTNDKRVCVENNLSDDYVEKVKSEVYMGAQNGSPDMDYNRKLTSFPTTELYLDVNMDGVYGLGEGIYKKRVGNIQRVVQTGDTRVTEMRFDVNGNRVSYKANSMVTKGDADIGSIIRKFTPNTMFYDENDPWNSNINPNLTYDSWEDIYRVGSASSNLYRYMNVPLRFRGTQKNILYADIDDSGTVTLGDIRLFNNPNFLNGSVVRLLDSDYNLSLYSGNPQTTPGTGVIIGIVNMDPADPTSPPKFAYADIDNDNQISVGDVRLTSVYGYKAGSLVANTDSDAPYEDPPGSGNWIFTPFAHSSPMSVTNDGMVFIENQAPPTEANEDDMLITPINTSSGIRRITEVVVANEKYNSGTRVSAGNVFAEQIKANMLRVGGNGDKRYVDMAIIPGKLGMDVQLSAPLMVERTSEITVSFNPPPQKNDKILVYVYDIGNFDTSLSHVDTRIVTYGDPVAKFQFTPYRGSIDDSGQYGSRYFRVHAFKMQDLPKDMSSASRLVRPPDGLYVDPYWENQMFRLGKLSVDAQTEFRYPKFIPTPKIIPPFNSLNIPPFPSEWENIYDCYEEFKSPIQPSPIAMIPDKKCLTLYEQRQPSFGVRLYDPDDPLDINDPYSIPLSTNYGVEPLYYFNVHGGGIAWLFTTYLDQAGIQKGIVQVNTDNTYYFWLWTDREYANVFDSSDQIDFLGSGGPTRWIDQDCTEGTGQGDPESSYKNKDNKLPPFGDISYGDTFGPYRINTYGVPMRVVNYSNVDEGGLGLVIARPTSSETPVEVTVYTKELMYDYNSTISHPPYFIRDFSQGIDYIGSTLIKVLPADPALNFVDVNWVDHALQYSKLNYTSGSLALSKMEIPPMPIIAARYNPILMDLQDDLRVYPGGQTHTGRIKGKVSSDLGLNDTGRGSGFNAYPAIFSKASARKRFTNNYDIEKEWQYDQFNKLGTEFYPLTDYGLFFILKNYDDLHYTFTTRMGANLQIKKITIKGPFATPKKLFKQQENKVSYTQSNNYYNELWKVPLQYDYSGELVIDETNYGQYEQVLNDFTNITSPYYPITGTFNPGFTDTVTYPESERNPQLEYNKRLHYEGARADATYTNSLANCFVIDEIIPVNRGKITVEVELLNGIIKKYEDCCTVKQDGFNVHALDLQTDKKILYPDIDQNIQVTLNEYEPKGYDPSYADTVKECNNAVVALWQDRGIYNPKSKAYDGAGDGWITRPPRSSSKTEASYQFDKSDDTNNDGKVSFEDFETEIIGTYDIASNTWHGGIIDGRTFNRNNGVYNFNMATETGNQITTVGWDFGGGEVKGNISPPDHIVSENEMLPVYVTAYKYGDDNNDRSFIYNLSNVSGGKITSDLKPFFELSHEVYLSAQAQIAVVPPTDYIVSVNPDPLTAGVTPELADPQNPLTFTLLDADGNPVDLKYGVPDAAGDRNVQDRDMWNKLIMDPHPDNDSFYGTNAILPQYYWLRTDLHNNDDTFITNTSLYSDITSPFTPIEVDFRERDKGKYQFKGFCANDQGSFEVFMYSPDRKHVGIGKVKVVLPDVSYKVTNTDDVQGNEFTTPGDPDFYLTAADNRLYKITAYVKNAQGIPMKGAGNTISVCGGSETETARFTLMSTAPYNFGWAYDQPQSSGYYNYGGRLNYMYGTDNFVDSFLLPRAGYDYNNNGQVDQMNKELFNLGGFKAYAYANYLVTPSGGVANIQGRFIDQSFWTYYNTRNWMWDDGKFEIDPMFLIYPEPAIDTFDTRWFNGYYGGPSSILRGWGLGAIYNSPHKGGYLFADIDKDKKLTYRDAFNLDKEGKVTFYLYAEDILSIGGLIGNNHYSNNNYYSDLIGGPGLYTKDSPKDVTKRFFNRYQQINTYTKYLSTTMDNTFKLDWDAMPNCYLELKAPIVELYNAETYLPLGKDILDTDSWDVNYGVINRILVRAYPADKRDLPLQTGASVVLDGNEYFPLSIIEKFYNGPQSETTIYGNIYESPVDPKARETIISFTPTGTGPNQAFLQYWNRNTRFNLPNFYMVGGMASMDVAKGIQIELMNTGLIKSKATTPLVLYVKEAGSKYPVVGAQVTVEGLGVNDTKTTDTDGKVEISVTPSNRGVLMVKATMTGMINGSMLLGVEEDVTPQFIDLDPVDILPDQNTAIISGIVKIGSAITINNVPVPVDENGKFRYEAKLTEKLNTFEVIAKDKTGKIVKKIINVEKPSENLQIALDLPERFVEAKEASIKGKVSKKNMTENSVNRAMWVFVNGVEAKVIPDEKYLTFDFEATVPLAIGRNRIEINVRTAEGFAKKVVEIPNYKKFLIELQIDNDIATINGNQSKIDAKPYIAYGRTYVPLRVVAEGFGAQVDWVPQTKGINVTLGEKIISMQIGSNRAIVNNQVVSLDAPPEIKNGRTYIPIRFVSEALGAEVNWNQNTRKVSITRLTME
jgi:hypothetical protein